MRKHLLVFALLSLGASSALAAPVCSQQTARGSWVYTCEGELPVGTPVRLLGTCTASKAGDWACQGDVNFGGQVLSQVLQGHATNNADCTGTISYANTVGGYLQPNPLVIDFVIFDQGDSIKGLPTNSGGVLACSLKRMFIASDH